MYGGAEKEDLMENLKGLVLLGKRKLRWDPRRS